MPNGNHLLCIFARKSILKGDMKDFILKEGRQVAHRVGPSLNL